MSSKKWKVFKESVFYNSLESLSRKIRTTLPPESYKYIEKVEQSLQVGSRLYKEYGKIQRPFENEMQESRNPK
jgi:hypothetical protein